jgi:hypothetical protein
MHRLRRPRMATVTITDVFVGALVAGSNGTLRSLTLRTPPAPVYDASGVGTSGYLELVSGDGTTLWCSDCLGLSRDGAAFVDGRGTFRGGLRAKRVPKGSSWSVETA